MPDTTPAVGPTISRLARAVEQGQRDAYDAIEEAYEAGIDRGVNQMAARRPEPLCWMVIIPTGALSARAPKWMTIGFDHPTAEAAAAFAAGRPGAQVVVLYRAEGTTP
jgi:hypothetical protein